MSRKKKVKDPDNTETTQKGIDFTKHKIPFKSVKTSMKSIIKDVETQKSINELVIRINDIVIDVYQFIKLYILKKLNDNQQLPVINSDFIKYCITALGTRDNRGKKIKETPLLQEILNFYTDEFKPINNNVKYQLNNLSFTLPYVIISVETSIKNNIKEHFVKRLAKFINIFGGNYYDANYTGEIQDNNSKEYKKEKKTVLYKVKKCIIENKIEELPPFMNEWYNTVKNNITPTNIEKTMAYDCKTNEGWSKYISISYYINNEFEKHNNKISKDIEQLKVKLEKARKEETKKKYNNQIKDLNCQIIKLYQILPLRNSCVPKYIFIDSATLVNILCDGNKALLLEKLKDNRNNIWNTYFNMDKSVFKIKDYNFNYTLVTDGIGCSLHFKHKNYKESKKDNSDNFENNDLYYIDDLSDEQIEEFKNKKIVTADPGKKYLLYMMDDENKVLKYSSSQRNMESLNKRNKRIKDTNKKQHQEITNAETELSKYNCKTNDYKKFKDYIKAKYECNKIIKKYYEKEINRKLNWRSKTYRQKSEDKFLNNIEKTYGHKDGVLICIGDWSNKNTINGLGSTMGIGLKKLVAKKYNTVLIDEYNTSKLCCNCHKENDNKVINSESLFRLLTCKHCNVGSSENLNNPTLKCSKFLNRDMNSCVNMQCIVKAYLTENRKRPQEFTRT
jgi:hypothetical protein